MSKLKNKVAVVTGGSSGIGLATALRSVARASQMKSPRPWQFSPQTTGATLPELTLLLTAE